MMTTTRREVTRNVYATSKPLELIESVYVKMCGRCGIHYTTKTGRPPVMKLCGDCKEVCTAAERRTYMTGR